MALKNSSQLLIVDLPQYGINEVENKKMVHVEPPSSHAADGMNRSA
jgi:hypothetical protein